MCPRPVFHSRTDVEDHDVVAPQPAVQLLPADGLRLPGVPHVRRRQVVEISHVRGGDVPQRGPHQTDLRRRQRLADPGTVAPVGDQAGAQQELLML